ncbi:MAG: BON domain-containing protein [Candidatus Korobacteraceae bacterium]
MNRIEQFAAKRSLWIMIFTMILAATFTLAGCSRNDHPDVKYAVDSAMTQNGLGVVKVSQDRNKGVVTIKGDVESEDQKARAENIARQAAPGYTIANELGVTPPGTGSQAKDVNSKLDSAIEDNYKAALKEHKNLDDQSISVDAKNGTLVLKGSVKTKSQQQEAVKLAKAVPNVQEVVNEIEVRPDKNATAQP